MLGRMADALPESRASGQRSGQEGARHGVNTRNITRRERKETLPFAATCMGSEIIMMSEVSQRKTGGHTMSLIRDLKYGRNELI